jgi:hypothetical protein
MNGYSMGSFYLAGSVQFRYVVPLEGLKDCVSLWDLFMDLTTCKADDGRTISVWMDK